MWSLYRVAMVGVYFSGATTPTYLYTVPTLTPKRRATSLTRTSGLRGPSDLSRYERSHQGAPMLGFKRFFNARRVLAGAELVLKIIKGQFDVPEGFGNDPFAVQYNMLAA